jgi:hypothetical protein
MAALSKDRERTAAAYKSGEFTDAKKRSHYTLDGRVFLFGEDKERRRIEIFERDRYRCKLNISGYCWLVVTLLTGEWHHDPSRSKGGDDSLKGGRTACGPCHRASHVQVRLGTIPLPPLETWEHAGEP